MPTHVDRQIENAFAEFALHVAAAHRISPSQAARLMCAAAVRLEVREGGPALLRGFLEDLLPNMTEIAPPPVNA